MSSNVDISHHLFGRETLNPGLLSPAALTNMLFYSYVIHTSVTNISEREYTESLQRLNTGIISTVCIGMEMMKLLLVADK